MIGATINFDSTGYEKLHLLVGNGQYLLDHRDCTEKTGYNEFEVWHGHRAGVFVVASATEPISLLMCIISHIYVHYPLAEKKKIAKLDHPEKVRVLVFSLFV